MAEQARRTADAAALLRPPADLRRLRDLTRYRADLVGVRTAEKNRVDKLLEDASIKLSIVASDIFGVSGRAMLDALIAGERDPQVLAEMARSRMRPKILQLQDAFAGLTLGTFDDHHRFLLSTMLARVDAVNDDIAALDAEIEEHLAPFADAAARLAEIPGVGPTAAAVIIAEIGVDMTRFPPRGHLCSWAKFAPGVHSSAGKTQGSGSTGHGNRYLARALGEAAVSAAPTETFLGARTGAWPDAAARRKPPSPSAAPSSSSSGTYSTTPTPRSTTSVPTTTTVTSTPPPNVASTSASSKPSATTSPSTRPPDHSRAQDPVAGFHFRTSCGTPGRDRPRLPRLPHPRRHPHADPINHRLPTRPCLRGLPLP